MGKFRGENPKAWFNSDVGGQFYAEIDRRSAALTASVQQTMESIEQFGRNLDVAGTKVVQWGGKQALAMVAATLTIKKLIAAIQETVTSFEKMVTSAEKQDERLKKTRTADEAWLEVQKARDKQAQIQFDQNAKYMAKYQKMYYSLMDVLMDTDVLYQRRLAGWLEVHRARMNYAKKEHNERMRMNIRSFGSMWGHIAKAVNQPADI